MKAFPVPSYVNVAGETHDVATKAWTYVITLPLKPYKVFWLVITK